MFLVRWFILFFALLLLYAGVQPLVFPDPTAATSQAPAYAWFHLVASAVALAAVLLSRGQWSPAFALGFGLVDIYQAFASGFGWIPQGWFRWTATDDVLHWTLGAILVALGLTVYALRRDQ